MGDLIKCQVAIATATQLRSQGGGLCTQRPATIVATTCTSRSSSGSHANGSRSSTTRSASRPGTSVPRVALVVREPRRRDAGRVQRLVERQRLLRPPRAVVERRGRRRRRPPRGRAPRPARRSRSRRARPSRAASGTHTCPSSLSPQKRSARSRSDGAWLNCAETATPSSAKRGTSSGARHCACSIRCRRPARCQTLARPLERVERLAVRAVADRVHADGPARLGACADDLGELLAARDLHAAAVEHPRGLRAERAVHEDLQVADAQQRRAEAAAERERAQRRQPLVRHRLPDAQREAALLVEPLPEPGGAEPAVLVVHAGDAARVRELHARAHRVDVLVGGNRQVALLEPPRRFLAQHPGRLAVRVALDDAAVDLEVAAGERERRPS